MYGGHINYFVNQAAQTAQSAAQYVPSYPK